MTSCLTEGGQMQNLARAVKALFFLCLAQKGEIHKVGSHETAGLVLHDALAFSRHPL